MVEMVSTTTAKLRDRPLGGNPKYVNRRGLTLFTLVSVVLCLGSHLAGAATLIPIALIDGDWANAVPTTGITIANSGALGGLSTARWGTPVSGSGQSGYNFTSTTPFNAPTDGSAFLLGTFQHLNFPITAPSLDTINLSLKIGTVINVMSVFGIDHDETPNSNPNPNDFVTIVSPVVNQEFSFEGNQYFFNLIGFSQNGGTTISSVYETQENAVNTAGLYGQITTKAQPVPGRVPDGGSAMAMLGLSLLGLGAARRALK